MEKQVYQSNFDKCLFFVPDAGAKPEEVVQMGESLWFTPGTLYEISPAGAEYSAPEKCHRRLELWHPVESMPAVKVRHWK